jgi:hypothetical protein
LKVSKSIYETMADLLAEMEDDNWTWLIDGVSGEQETPNSIMDKAKRYLTQNGSGLPYYVIGQIQRKVIL